MTVASEARRNILLLAIAQALYSSCTIIVFATAGLVGLVLAPDPSFATLPVTSFVLGALVTTVPASLLMQKIGRPPVFKFGAMVSVLGSLLAVWAIFHHHFPAFCFAAALAGCFQATSGFYRFAAAESADDTTRSQAISWVLTGGVVAALIGTQISSRMADYFAGFQFAGSYSASAVLALINLCIIFMLRLPKPSVSEIAGPQRSWSELLRQPKLLAAMAAAMIAYAVMNLMMTAAPVAMIGCGFTQADASWVIQWHVLAMFVPSFFTGEIIKRFGAERVTATGMIILLSAGAASLFGITFTHFSVALILLGLGWNFGFIGGTTLLTQCYRPSERGKIQAANDFGIAGLMAIASFSSGMLLSHFGWHSVAYALFAPVAVALAMTSWLMLQRPVRA